MSFKEKYNSFERRVHLHRIDSGKKGIIECLNYQFWNSVGFFPLKLLKIYTK